MIGGKMCFDSVSQRFLSKASWINCFWAELQGQANMAVNKSLVGATQQKNYGCASNCPPTFPAMPSGP